MSIHEVFYLNKFFNDPAQAKFDTVYKKTAAN